MRKLIIGIISFSFFAYEIYTLAYNAKGRMESTGMTPKVRSWFK